AAPVKRVGSPTRTPPECGSPKRGLPGRGLGNPHQGAGRTPSGKHHGRGEYSYGTFGRDGTGNGIVEYVAGVDDFEVAEATYRAAVARWPAARKLCDRASGWCML